MSSGALRYDTLSAMMVAMVTGIATLIHIYSVGYMSHDATVPRFFSYLSLFTFAMLMLVTADNLVQLFFGWEGVGLMSYLLIGYWYDRPSANKAAMKAFVVKPRGRPVLRHRHRAGVHAVRNGRVSGHLRRRAGPRERHLPCAGQQLARLRGHRRAAVPGRHGQVRAAWPAHLAARRHGRPDPGVRADPRRDDGHGRGVPGGAHVAGAGVRAGGAGLRGLHRRNDLPGGGDHRLRAERHQAHHRLLHHVAAWATCSWRRASAPTRFRCSTSSPMRSSRRCCSWAPAR